MRNYKEIETGSETRKMYEFEKRNNKGEKITVEITECEAGKTQLKMGFPKNWLCVRTYAEKENGDCSGKYDPFTIVVNFKDENGRYVCHRKVDIKNLLTVSDENKRKCLEIVEDIAFA